MQGGNSVQLGSPRRHFFALRGANWTCACERALSNGPGFILSTPFRRSLRCSLGAIESRPAHPPECRDGVSDLRTLAFSCRLFGLDDSAESAHVSWRSFAIVCGAGGAAPCIFIGTPVGKSEVAKDWSLAQAESKR